MQMNQEDFIIVSKCIFVNKSCDVSYDTPNHLQITKINWHFLTNKIIILLPYAQLMPLIKYNKSGLLSLVKSVCYWFQVKSAFKFT